jgi:hypothetical protein
MSDCKGRKSIAIKATLSLIPTGHSKQKNCFEIFAILARAELAGVRSVAAD